MNARQAFKDQLLNVKTRHLDGACDAGVQWSSNSGEPADHGEDFCPQLTLQLDQIRFAVRVPPGREPCCILSPSHIRLVSQEGCDLRTVERSRQYLECFFRGSRLAEHQQ